MEEIEELRAKVVASMSATGNPNSKLQKNRPKPKEEGELSTSDEDEVHTSSAAQSTGTTTPPVEPSVASGNEKTQSSNMGKRVAAYGPASSGDIQLKTSVKQNYSKHFEKNLVQSKPGNHYNPGWYAPSVPNNNLVIRFSDDDSGSDSEEYKTERTSERKENTLGVDGFKRPSASSHLESENSRQNANNQMKRMPKKVPLNSRYFSSITKMHGTNSRGSEPVSAEKASPICNSDLVNKTYAGQDHVFNQAVSMNNSKLESLRQQIAIRENQLKIHQSKKTISGSLNDYNGFNLNNGAAKKSRPASDKTLQLVSSQPEKKRLKLDEPYQSKLNYGQRQMLVPATKSIPKLKGPLPENIVHKDKILISRSQFTKEIPLDTSNLSTDIQIGKTDRKMGVSPGHILAGVKDGESSVSRLETNSRLPNKQGNCSISGADKGTRLADPSTVLNQTLQLAQMTPRADDGAACQLKIPSPKNSNTDGSKLRNTFGGPHSSSSSSLNKATQHHNIEKRSECNEVIPSDRILGPSCDNIFEKCSVQVPENKFETSNAKSNASPINTSLLNRSGPLNLAGHQSVDLQTLMKLEEMYDKDLEEAQEERRRCEMEEQNALKAYRTAQRALFEANARCTQLYRRRELLSAQVQHFITEDSSSLWSSGWHKDTETGLDSLNIVLEADANLLPSLSHQMHAEPDGFNQLGPDSNTQHTNDAVANTSYRTMNGRNLASEQCSEPNASASELLLHNENNALNRVSTPSNHTNMSADEDEQFDHRTVQSRLLCEREENFEEGEMNVNDNPERKSLTDNARDYALLEASLRSKLVARLGKKTDSRDCHLHYSGAHTVDKGVESLAGNKEFHMDMGNQPSIQAVQKQVSDVEGTDGLGKSICQLSIQVYNPAVGDKCLSDYGSHGTADPEESGSSLTEACRPTAPVSSLPSSVLGIVFRHTRLACSINFKRLQPRTQEKCTCDTSHDDCNISSYTFLHGFLRSHLTEDSLRGLDMGEMDFNACDLSIDPYWPVCMFELRGKCNDAECLWQHVKDYSRRNIKRHDPSTTAGKFSQYLQRYTMSAPPTYLVGLDLLKADLHTSGSILSESIGRYWQEGFSTSFAVPFSIQRNLLSDVPSFCGSDCHIKGQGGWNRQSLHFQIQDGSMKQLQNGLTDLEQSLDLALRSIEDFNKLEGRPKALSILSRALEENPTSVVLWIVYLHIYYRNEKTIGKDDMFSHAINNNEGSYELWLMFINSRVQLDGRLVAYDTALLALCRHSSAPDRDKVHASACILDLLLQMMDCLYMSGGIGKAIQKIYGLLNLTATDVADHSSVLLLDILTCLTVSDKCIFWVCCVYFVMYRKLPDAVVKQFQFEKEFPSAIEWLPVQLTDDEKLRVVELIEMGVDSVSLGINGSSYEGQTTPRMAHLLAVSHVRCVAVLESVECSKILLEKYIKLYPTCLELVLTSARLHRNCSGHLGFEGFEDALRNWPREIPGIQCIWNQYAQCALENGEIDFTKQLMLRWFQSVWKVDCPQSDTLDISEDNGLCGSSEAPSSPNPGACDASNPKDKVFGLLNLSLHKHLQNDQVGARLAIDSALKVAAPEDFNHCVREHAVFVLSDLSEPTEDDAPIMNLLNSYLVDTRFAPLSEPLSRKFYQGVRKPRVRQLLNNIFGSVSTDYSLINSVLEAWFGPSLLPERFGELKDLVDFVEALMEMFPANYQFALSVCQLITREFNSNSVASASAVYWASSLLFNSIYRAFPVASEQTWVEVANMVSDKIECLVISESFYHEATIAYPFSIKLWKSYYNHSKMTGKTSVVIEAARKRGIKLD